LKIKDTFSKKNQTNKQKKHKEALALPEAEVTGLRQDTRKKWSESSGNGR
jgi:hypothetical protein